LKTLKTTPFEKKLISLQNRVDRIQALADFLKTHPAIATISSLKPASNGLMGLVIDDKAFVRPQGLNKPGLRMEKWMEDAFTEVELKDRVVCEDVTGLSTEELETLLGTISHPYDMEDETEE
jgi:hypothetical protein